jgi:membrane protein
MSELPPPPVPDGPLFKWIQQNRSFDRIRSGLRGLRPWKGQQVNVYDVLRFFVLGLINGSVAMRSAAISFRLFLAFFPAMILLLSIIPYTPLETAEVLSSLEMLFPMQVVELFEQTVADLINQRQGTLISVGVILLLYYASSSVNSILLSFGESPHVPGKPHWLLYRLLSVVLLFVLTILLGVAVFLIGFSGDVIRWMDAHQWINADAIPWLTLARWTLSFALVYASVNMLYHAGSGAMKAWGVLNVGATGATLLLVLTTWTFSWIIGQFSSYNTLYGSLGTLMLTLVWLNSSSSILLLGFELNAAVSRAQMDATKSHESDRMNPIEITH